MKNFVLVLISIALLTTVPSFAKANPQCQGLNSSVKDASARKDKCAAMKECRWQAKGKKCVAKSSKKAKKSKHKHRKKKKN